MWEKCRGNRVSFFYGLLQLRNTPSENTGSPAQRLMARRTATKLPTVQKLLKPEVVPPLKIQQDIERRQTKAKNYFDQRTTQLKPLQPEDTIRVRVGNQWKPARLLPPDQQPNRPRSYNMETERGTIWRRNRRDILRTKEHNIFNREPPDDGLDGSIEAAPTPPQGASLNKPPKPPDPNEHPPQNPAVASAPTRHQNPQIQQPVQTRYGRTTRLPTYLSGDYDLKR